MQYYYLKDDLSDVTDTYDTNPAITEAQRRIWYRDGRRPAITQKMLGNTDDKSLRLLEEDGFDGDTVGSLSANSAQCFWDYNMGHVFPRMRDLVRFGVFMHLDIYHIVALVLKGEWERFFAQDIMGWRANLGIRLSEVLPEEVNQKMRDANNRFNPDSHKIHELLQAHGNIAESAGYTADTFDSLVQDMLLSELHWCANQSKVLTDFAATKSREIAVARLGSPEQQQAFWLAKCGWTQLQMQLDELYYRQESLKLQNAETERQWLHQFGPAELQLREQEIRRANLERRLLLKQANPACTPEEIDEKVHEEEARLLRELKEKKGIIEIMSGPRPPVEGGSADAAAVENYRKECKKCLRRTKMLTHPDRYAGPDYQNLTEEQRNELTKLFLKACEVDPDELGYPTNHILHDMRSLEALHRVLERVEAIIAAAGLEIDVEYVIRGETIAEQIEWLQRDIVYIEKDIERARAELQVLMTDAETARKRRILDCESEHDTIKAEFEKRIDECRRQADALEAQLAKLFKESATS